MDWIERLFHANPDGGSGSLEVSIIAGTVVALLLMLASVAKLFPAVRRWLEALREPVSLLEPQPLDQFDG